MAIGKDVDENQTINNVSVFVCLRATVTLQAPFLVKSGQAAGVSAQTVNILVCLRHCLI